MNWPRIFRLCVECVSFWGLLVFLKKFLFVAWKEEDLLCAIQYSTCNMMLWIFIRINALNFFFFLKVMRRIFSVRYCCCLSRISQIDTNRIDFFFLLFFFSIEIYIRLCIQSLYCMDKKPSSMRIGGSEHRTLRGSHFCFSLSLYLFLSISLTVN